MAIDLTLFAIVGTFLFLGGLAYGYRLRDDKAAKEADDYAAFLREQRKRFQHQFKARATGWED